MADPVSPTGIETSSAVDVVVEDHQTDMTIDADRWAALAAQVLVDVGAQGELTLTFVDVDEITALNREHMGVDGPTDVLSFPLDAFDTSFPGEPVLLGDVVVCPAVAADAASTHAGTIDDELALLVVHGCLHVMGHDHAEPDETAAMRARELELLTTYHWQGAAPAGFRHDHHDHDDHHDRDDHHDHDVRGNDR